MKEKECEQFLKDSIAEVSAVVARAVIDAGACAEVSTLALLNIMLTIAPNEDMRSDLSALSERYQFVAAEDMGVRH